MFVVYIYDVKANNKKKFNRVKRLFYYYLNKIELKKDTWRTKSTLAVPPKMEKTMDRFFNKFEKDVVVFKLFTDGIEQLS